MEKPRHYGAEASALASPAGAKADFRAARACLDSYGGDT